jgi:uncharacterized protein DUF397
MATEQDLTNARWRKSSFSGSGAQCVEWTPLPGMACAVRDSKNASAGALVLPVASWASFGGQLLQRMT